MENIGVFAAFQFHKGTIRTLLQLFEVVVVVYFNSIKVQLEPGRIIANDGKTINFNSIKVQLEQSNKEAIASCNSYFNSIKVQLEQQFVSYFSAKSVFQFHKGTIRTFLFPSMWFTCIHFNSIKVQLELKFAQKQIHRPGKFQFHKGTIRTASPL